MNSIVEWLVVITISIMSNDGVLSPKTQEIVSRSDFAMCSLVKADIDFIFRNPYQTVVIKGDCTTVSEYEKQKIGVMVYE